MDPKFFWTQYLLDPKFIKKMDPKLFLTKKNWTNFFLYLRTLNFGSKLFLDTTFLMTNHFFAIFSAIFFSNFKFFWPQIFSPTCKLPLNEKPNVKLMSLTWKMDRCLCLRFLLRWADTNSRGFEPATLVAGPAALTYWATQDA